MRRAEPRRLAVWPLLAAGLVAAAPPVVGDDAFAGGTAAMVVHDLRSGQVLRLGGERTALRLPPCSTFKVPNTLIALAAGAVDPEDSYVEWDPVRAPREAFWSDAWSQGQDLESAFRRSAVWYYQELARRVGGER
ncbi:MAG TPA: penicillin-binding transpeptidase domain-containing protein, partial [Thermoanaerobaculia bacterium]|nr:penicillin-binding transpeptidase domain-containing protein [Thermoanaerobaculia bacterium]